MSDAKSIDLEMRGDLAVVGLTQTARGNPSDEEVSRDLWDRGKLKKLHPEHNNLEPPVRRWTADLHRALQRAWVQHAPICCSWRWP